ncbi:MAG TPA: 3-carboxy-cis,cis-muconate cycloisomerase [Ktedonobacterales bacterium]
MDARHTRVLLDLLFSTEEMRLVFSDHGRLQGMLDFERALALVEGRLGVIPAQAAEVIARPRPPAAFDLAALASEAEQAGNLAIPLIRALTALVARDDAEAARYVHWGATSQDVIDSGLALQMRAGLDLLDDDLARLAAALAQLAQTYRATPMAGRTWLQQAAPITFGLKVAGWLSAVKRDQQRLRELRGRALAAQVGGAVGSLAAFGAQGLAVADAVADELGLQAPDIPWHAQRDRVAEVATVLGLLVGTLGKLARDLALLAQSEVAEAREPGDPQRGGSSTMPQKRNPVGAAVALAAAQRVPALVATLLAAMPQEHERGLDGWQAEWETLPEMFLLAAGALRRMREAMEGLEVDTERMRANLDVTHGFIYAEALSLALAQHVGRERAHALIREAVQRATRRGRHLRETLAADKAVTAHLTPAELDALFDPQRAIGLAEQLIQRALDAPLDGPSVGQSDEQMGG